MTTGLSLQLDATSIAKFDVGCRCRDGDRGVVPDDVSQCQQVVLDVWDVEDILEDDVDGLPVHAGDDDGDVADAHDGHCAAVCSNDG